MRWQVEPIWKGRTAVIVAGGASFSLVQCRQLGMAHARDLIKVIAINDAVYPCWFSDILYACDNRWWDHHRGVPGFAGTKLRLMVPDGAGGADTNAVAFDDVHWVESSGTIGFDSRPQFLRSGGNSGYQALHLCAHLKAEKVILVGFDMHGDHWFGDHPVAVRKYGADMEGRIRDFVDLATSLNRIGLPVVNASPNSALDMFRFTELSDELENVERAMQDQDKKDAEAKSKEAEAQEKLKSANSRRPSDRTGNYRTSQMDAGKPGFEKR